MRVTGTPRPIPLAALILGASGCAAELPPWTTLADFGSGGAADAGSGDGGRDLAVPGPGDAAPRLDARPAADRGSPADARPDGRTHDAAPPDGAPHDAALVDGEVPDRELPDLDLPDLDLPDLDLPDLDPPIPDRGVVTPERCNGLDDDENGVVDDAPVCGGVIASECRIYLGMLNFVLADLEASDTWGDCPGADTDGYDAFDNRACVGTRRDGAFRRLGLQDDDIFNDNNHFGLALRCDGSPVAAWVQRHCRFYLGQGDNDAGPAAPVNDTWGPCPGAEGTRGQQRCVSTGGDGRFHPLRLLGIVDDNDSFAVAFRCDDPSDRSRAEAMQSSAAVAFAWANDDDLAGGDGAGEWLRGCPGPDSMGAISGDGFGCATSAFDGRFHHFPISEAIGEDDAFGIALIPHPDAP